MTSSHESQFQAIIDGTGDAFVGVDLASEVVIFNRAAEALFVLPSSAVLGRPIAAAPLPMSLRNGLELSLHRLRAGEPPSADLRIKEMRADGRLLMAEVRIFGTGAGAGAMVIAGLSDVTEYEEAEEKARRVGRILKTMSEGNQALIRASNEDDLFRTMCNVLVEHGGYRMAWIGLVEHDEDKTIRPVAHAGHENGYLAQTRISWGDNPYGRGPSGMSVRTGTPQFNNDVTSNPVMTPWRQAALERGYLSSISLPLKDAADTFGALTLYAGETNAFGPEEVKLLVELAEDVSYGIVALRTRQAHANMERTLAQIQKMESLGHLTGGVAHDFNNLLQVILSSLDLSLRRLGEKSVVAGLLKNALSAAERGAGLTGQLLAFSRRQPLRPDVVRVERLMADMISLLRRTLGERIDIQLRSGGEPWTVLVDANQLQNAILNLAINARDAMPDRGRLTIELANACLDEAYVATHKDVPAGRYVMVKVSDTGSGMPPEVMERAFEPFFTTKPEGKGTGLGLSMVYGFIRQSGGTIRVESVVGRGTSFTLYLPRAEPTGEAPEPSGEAGMPRGNGETILMVEDDDGVRASVVGQLTELGYRVSTAADGEAALAILESGVPVDLLFTDMIMPGALGGCALADEARSIAPSLPVLFTSGYADSASPRDGALEAGITLLSKPYRVRQLAEAIRRALATPGAASVPMPTEAGGLAQARAVVLLVDDQELLLEMMSECLEEAGYQVVATGTPSAALAVLERGQPVEALVTDFNLPEMTGVQLIREALGLRPGLGVVLASGSVPDLAEPLDPTITLLAKPFRPSELTGAIETALAARRSVPA